ncbi:hypothetical protein Q0F98_21615 [Paenibacillus amylolyticus]|nr:hypothetical protein Q0F98_21615 [Paenibacillus amylolyticus]
MANSASCVPRLFSNPGGDGFDPSVYYLTSADSGYSDFAQGGLDRNSHARSTFNFRYQAALNDSTGNIPIDPKRLIAPSEEDRPTLLERMNEAGFSDGAGNPVAAFNGIGTVPFADNANPGGTFPYHYRRTCTSVLSILQRRAA